MDTFVVRSILVPAMLSIVPRFGPARGCDRHLVCSAYPEMHIGKRLSISTRPVSTALASSGRCSHTWTAAMKHALYGCYMFMSVGWRGFPLRLPFFRTDEAREVSLRIGVCIRMLRPG